MSFTDQLPRVATAADCAARWGGEPNGKNFRCYLCGHQFQPGDIWRWVYSAGMTWKQGQGCCNFLVCRECDGPEVKERWKRMHQAWEKVVTGRYWWFAE
jgi:hypothetical protein